MKIPPELKYSKDHGWVRIEGAIAIVGITDYAQHKLADVVFVELPEIGKKVTQLGPLAVIESVKTVVDVLSPLSGEVIEVNKELTEKPELVNQGPYEKGWIAKIRLLDPEELKNLMDDKAYEASTRV